MKQRIRKKISSKRLQNYLPNIEPLFHELIQMSESLNPEEYRTSEIRLKESVAAKFDTEAGEEFFDAMVKSFIDLDLSAFAKQIKKIRNREIKKRSKIDERFGILLSAIADAEKVCPNIGLLILFRTNPIEELAKAFDMVDLISEFENLKGEKAARCAIRLYREVAEMLYTNYLKTLAELCCALEGKTQLSYSKQLGHLSIQVHSRLRAFGYADIVDPDTGWIRNASCHGHWIYEPKLDSIFLWDLNKPKKEMKSIEVYQKAIEMYRMVTEIYYPILHIYLSDKVVNHWLPLLKYFQKNFQKILAGDKKHEDVFAGKFEKLFENLSKIDVKR